MRISIAKRADGAGVLKCVRADGSESWQKQSERHAAHFTFHDLTHFAVETVLGTQRAFFGLVASGWEIADTTGKGERGPLPMQAGHVELLVGLLDMERPSGAVWSAEEFHQAAVTHAELRAVPAPRKLTEAELSAIRRRRAELFADWEQVPVGQALELEFPEAQPLSATAAVLSTRKRNISAR